ncbi:MAG: N-acetyltransferase [Gammaproteobacteria bacterium]|nr:N-acetyltransferase [Gammaproteobacteria bacterium]MDH5692308.1 N-acetyltransferase [Gammaproteobacteria bacterium]
MIIRPETENDRKAIFDLTELAFQDMPYADGDEQFVPERLRSRGELTLSLVAEDEGRIVAHVAISPVTISDGSKGWYGLGPVSVTPERQRQGIGTKLIRRALSELKGLGAAGCVVLGDPNYYQRFGFATHPKFILAGVPPEYFQVLVFGQTDAKGEVTFSPAFYEDNAQQS